MYDTVFSRMFASKVHGKAVITVVNDLLYHQKSTALYPWLHYHQATYWTELLMGSHNHYLRPLLYAVRRSRPRSILRLLKLRTRTLTKSSGITLETSNTPVLGPRFTRSMTVQQERSRHMELWSKTCQAEMRMRNGFGTWAECSVQKKCMVRHCVPLHNNLVIPLHPRIFKAQCFLVCSCSWDALVEYLSAVYSPQCDRDRPMTLLQHVIWLLRFSRHW